jgi:hypothetical protein
MPSQQLFAVCTIEKPEHVTHILLGFTAQAESAFHLLYLSILSVPARVYSGIKYDCKGVPEL